MRNAPNRNPSSRPEGVLLAIGTATLVIALFGVPRLSPADATLTSATTPPTQRASLLAMCRPPH